MMIGMKKSVNNQPLWQKRIKKQKNLIVTVGMENTTHNKPHCIRTNKQQSAKWSNRQRHIGPEHHPCRFETMKVGGTSKSSFSQFAMMTMVLVDLLKIQPIYRSKNTIIRKRDAKLVVYWNSFAKYYLYRFLDRPKLGPIVIVFA